MSQTLLKTLLTLLEKSSTPATPDTAGEWGLYFKSDGLYIIDDAGNVTGPFTTGGGSPSVCDGRLTLETGVPVSITDQTAKTTVYFTPYIGNKIGLYNGATWDIISFSELSLSLSGYTANKNYDIWIYNNSGTAAMESTIWTDDTTRATALARQDGILCKTGTLTRRYVGTIRITGTTGQCEISFGLTPAAGGSQPKLFVYNEYNKVPAVFSSRDSTDNWAYTTGAWRAKNAGGTGSGLLNAFKYVNGNRLAVSANEIGCFYGTTAGQLSMVALGLDSTSAAAGIFIETSVFVTGQFLTSTAKLAASAVGYHYIQELEYGGTNVTFSGDQAGPTLMQTGAVYETQM